MPNAGDSFTVVLERAHLEWGTHRYTGSRGMVYGEGYIPIPKRFARNYNIYNSNHPTANTVYNCTSVDGFYNHPILAQGSTSAGDIYAKQFSAQGNLKALGDWFLHLDVQVGDHVRITWTSPTDVVIELIQQP